MHIVFEQTLALRITCVQGGNGGASRQIYYDGEYCDAEEMPNGFTKIRKQQFYS